jgi:hypothetical protein
MATAASPSQTRAPAKPKNIRANNNMLIDNEGSVGSQNRIRLLEIVT